MALTPVDILHTQFKTSLKGYSKPQVDEFVRCARESIEELIKDKSDLQRKVESLEEELERIRKIESAMSSALTIAQQSADELRTEAHKQAELIIKEAEQARVRMVIEAQQQAEKLRAEIALLESARDRFEAEFRAMLSGYSEWLDKRTQQVDVSEEVAAKQEVA